LDKKVLETKIYSKINILKEGIKELRIITKPIEPENAIGRISRMDAINNKAINDRMLRKAEEKLKGLYLAIRRLTENSFGKCIQCNKQINEQRILLMPHITKCVRCASLR
jgi:DnaK suppressor protein